MERDIRHVLLTASEARCFVRDRTATVDAAVAALAVALGELCAEHGISDHLAHGLLSVALRESRDEILPASDS